MTHETQPTVFVLDFGAQYAQLIARRVREARVFSEIVPFDITAEEIERREPAALILSGGPASVYAEGAPHMDPAIFDLGIPVLGFCYGIQEMALHLGGEIPKTDIGEYGFAELTVTAPSCQLLEGVPETSQVWMSHRDSVGTAPQGFVVTARTATTQVAAMEDAARKLFATQFHPEVAHTEFGQHIIRRFLHDIADIPANWTMVNIIDDAVERIREQVGSDRVICGLSGGVDSSVVAALLHRAIGDQLTCVFVDHGMLRLDEAEQVVHTFRDTFHVNLVHVDAEDRYLGAARRRRRPGGQAPDHRRGVLEHLLRGGHHARGRAVARAGHALPGRDRVGQQARGQDQEPPQPHPVPAKACTSI